MVNIFDGLEKFGFKKKDLESITVIGQEKKKADEHKSEAKKFNIKDFLIQKPYECPICYKNFTSPALKVGKVRLDRVDFDLRPIYENIEPLLYDVVMCNYCGYAAVTQKFTPLPDKITTIVQDFLNENFEPMPTVDEIDVETAIDRYKMALLCATKRGAKNGERAYISLKLTWLNRILGNRENELAFMALSFQGFKEAYSMEPMPICGLGAHTILFLLAAFSKTLGHLEESTRYLSSIIIDRTAPNSIKERARDLKDEIQKR